jgi:predicted amidophosphoribosyltransferase
MAVDNARAEFTPAKPLDLKNDIYCACCGSDGPGAGDTCPLCGRTTPEDAEYVAYLNSPIDPRD